MMVATTSQESLTPRQTKESHTRGLNQSTAGYDKAMDIDTTIGVHSRRFSCRSRGLREHRCALAEVPATPWHARWCWVYLTHWMGGHAPIAAAHRIDIALAAYEVLAHSVERADPVGNVATISMWARYRPINQTMRVSITDHHTGHTPTDPPDPGFGEFGPALVDALCDTSEFHSGPAGNTTFLHWTLP